ncbi:basic amino acid ABC transporter substrate-binding protein [Thermoflavimicrobium daqui]|jgi:polar amino acid transport system substrate-binding protein|uniref:Basic amino acid ABC transporter substrate-binding protein n=1 Tax=Thermoflavimicrobium daqui TaxID=2137476 RepID=A0A364K710_9BACL|nr:basic amino acid ABC transporter substrate-binding protein [Thermoflavimicrobium daqui]RAL26084.1 basic amino acid ABC transporter substrate-binding protein [Thermoflavimicrobium daqui]
MRKSLSIFITAFIAMSLLLIGCQSTPSSEANSPQQETKKIRFATEAQFPPFEKVGPDGKLTGFDIDVIDAIAKEIGLDIEKKHMGWDAVFDSIDRGKADVAMAAITITEDRKKKYDFSDSYFDAKQLILLPKGSSISTLKELNGKKIGVMAGTTGEEVVKNAFGKTYSNLKGYDDTPGAIDDLQLKRLDAVVTDKAVAIDYLKKLGQDKFKTVEDSSLPIEQYGILVQKGNKELLNKMNEGLKKIRENGTYDKIYEKYFGKE